MNDSWQGGHLYDRFMGRWSVLIAREFLSWLDIPPGRSWLDVGSGTGSLTRLILETQQPRELTAIDSSYKFISHAQHSISNPIAIFKVGLAGSLDLLTGSIDAAVSGLVLNFVSQPETAVKEMLRVTRPEGVIGIFLWDYAQGMQMLRYFWDAAVELNSMAVSLDEGIRFPLCREGELENMVCKAGLNHVESTAIEVRTKFESFDDYWQPFLKGVGPAPGYNLSLKPYARKQLEEVLYHSLPVENDGSISLTARAWAVKGTV